ncbi:hypothetical protein LSAT2_011835 [Lamellibrachia satsuma]|nr:hypothetical protein LSAT2_011835 [Lamellibrachia satsuma]
MQFRFPSLWSFGLEKPKKQQTKSPKPQQSARTEVTEQTPQPSEDNEAGEWVTAQSKKKNKRNKRGQDEGGKKEMPATPKQEEVKVEDVPVEGVKAEATPAAEEPQVEAAAPVEKKQKKRKETKLPAKSDVTLKSNVSLDVSAEKELKDTADMQIKQSDPPQVEEKQKVSPKKSKKEKKAAKVAVSVPDVVVKDSVITVTTDAKLEPQPSGVEAELIAAMEDEVVTPQAEDTQKEAGDEMATKLSKNSRKKKTKESREKYAVCEAFEKNPKSESMESAGQTVTSPSETTGADVSTAQQTSPTDRLQTGPVAMTTEVADGAAESLLKSEEQSPVTFDELGEWQEAKPVKSKKKRARRDN